MSSGNITKKVELMSIFEELGQPEVININGININLSYGAKEIALPFSLKLKDFNLDRFPGSESPSFYSSTVAIVDGNIYTENDYIISINNILDYKAYRFFQSTYDVDEKGTMFLANYDKAGTRITYFGYFVLIIGMIWTILNKNSYFSELKRKSKEIKLIQK